MVEFVSPGVYTIEKDISDFPVNLRSSVVGILGFATKGPVNEAKLITSGERLTKLFGKPSASIPGQGLEGALEILEATNQIYFVRASSGSADSASATLQYGSSPAVQVEASGFGVTLDLYLDVEVFNSNGEAVFSTPKQFDIPSGTVGTGSTQGVALKKVIGGDLASDEVGVEIFNDPILDATGFIYANYAGAEAELRVTAYSALPRDPSNGVSALRRINLSGNASNILTSAILFNPGSTFAQLTPDIGTMKYLVQTQFPGTGYNLSSDSQGKTTGLSIELDKRGRGVSLLTVNEDGVAAENFQVSLLNGANFIETAINTGDTNLKSEFIKGNVIVEGQDVEVTPAPNFLTRLSAILGPTVAATVSGGNLLDGNNMSVSGARFVKLIDNGPDATQPLLGGTNGFPTDSDDQAVVLIGDATASPKTGMQALDDDVLNISIAIVPGIHNESVQNSLITLAETTQNFIVAVAPPLGANDTAQDAIDWSNGKTETRSSPLNSSYAAAYFPHVKVFSVFDGEDRFYDPAIYGVRQMAVNDSLAEPWFAPAGFRRGRLTKVLDVDVKLNRGDRDALYSGGNVINPIVNFPQRGIVVFGQRTTQRDPTALDRVNVRRLLIFLRKVLLASTQRFVFEPNDPITWEQVVGLLNPLLADIQNRRGITEFKVICDETTNTPVRIDRNELWTKILLKPTKTAEILIFEINVTNQSAQIGN